MSQAAGIQAGFVGHEMKQAKRHIAISGRERINNQCVWIWKGGHNMKFYFPLLVEHYGQRFVGADSGKNSHPLLPSTSFPKMPFADSRIWQGF